MLGNCITAQARHLRATSGDTVKGTLCRTAQAISNDPKTLISLQHLSSVRQQKVRSGPKNLMERTPPPFYSGARAARKAGKRERRNCRRSGAEKLPLRRRRRVGKKMTAEIAILNKSAVALAADSAVTIGDGGSAKIYNTVNKIFEISKEQPLGIMIYGSLSYLGLPLEVLVKRYREEFSGKKIFNSVLECAEDFAVYLESNVPYDLQNENSNVERIVYWSLKNISDKSKNTFINNMITLGKVLPSKANGICQEVIAGEIKRLTGKEGAKCFSTGQLANIDRKYQTIIDDQVAARFSWLQMTEKTRALIRRLVRLALHREELSRFRTGIVISGFGDKEICPTLCSFELDGIINGKLKRSDMELVDIDRDGPGADIKAFAQREMVQRFLRGVDPSYDLYLQNRLEDAMKDFAASIFRGQGNTDQQAAGMVDNLSPVIEKMRNDFAEKSDEHKDHEFKDNVLNMVQFMPNQELATLAESLIDLTSLKRRMSAERETVGGDIDVAIISKSDGFVWIKRKHYFPADLNPRFFHRHYNS